LLMSRQTQRETQSRRVRRDAPLSDCYYHTMSKYRLLQGKNLPIGLLDLDATVEEVFRNKDLYFNNDGEIIRHCKEGDTSYFETWKIQSVTKKGQGFDLRLRISDLKLGDDIYELKGFTSEWGESFSGTLIQYLGDSSLPGSAKKSEWWYKGHPFDLQGALAE
jgi:hypothetical protein